MLCYCADRFHIRNELKPVHNSVPSSIEYLILSPEIYTERKAFTLKHLESRRFLTG